MKTLKHFAGINKPFLFVLPDTHGSYEIERQKLIALQSIGVNDVLIEGYLKDNFLRAGEFMLASDLISFGFNLHEIEDAALFQKVAFMMDLYYLVCFKFSNLILDFEKFSPEFLNNFKFLSPHESFDSLNHYLSREYGFQINFETVDYAKSLEIVQKMQFLLDEFVLNQRNLVFKQKLDTHFQNNFANALALVVGKKHLKNLYQLIGDLYNIVEV